MAEQILQAGKRNFADFAVFQRDRGAMVALGADGVHAQQFAGHLEAGDLLLAGRH